MGVVVGCDGVAEGGGGEVEAGGLLLALKGGRLGRSGYLDGELRLKSDVFDGMWRFGPLRGIVTARRRLTSKRNAIAGPDVTETIFATDC